jgi:hypothetical protein
MTVASPGIEVELQGLDIGQTAQGIEASIIHRAL